LPFPADKEQKNGFLQKNYFFQFSLPGGNLQVNGRAVQIQKQITKGGQYKWHF